MDFTLQNLASFVKKTEVCDVPKEFSFLPLTLEQYVTLLTKDCNMILLEMFTRAWCKEHPKDEDIWKAYILHFRRDCDRSYFYWHMKEYRKLGMAHNWL